EANETVILTLAANSAYRIGSPAAATVTILDNEPFVTIVATDASAAEDETGADPGTFTVTRTGATTADLTVNFTVTGTAATGAAYTAFPTSLTTPAGQASATVTVRPSHAPLPEANETVTLTLSANSAYRVGSPAAATVTILDNEPTVTI